MNLSGECVDNQAGRLMVQAYQFAYAITDRALRVVEIYDPLGIIGPSRDGQYGTLYDVTPELIGSEKNNSGDFDRNHLTARAGYGKP